MPGRALVVCPNPAVDRVAVVPPGIAAATVRASEVLDTPGGKGVHVALVAAALGAHVILLIPAGGATGERLLALLRAEPLEVRVIRTGAETRMTYAVVGAGAAEPLNVIEPSPVLDRIEVSAFVASLPVEISAAGLVAASGSIPPGLPVSLYADLVRTARARDIRVLVDASGPALDAVLAAEPELVKPNADEAAAALGRGSPGSERELAAMARALRARGARNALVTAGRLGAVLATDTGEVVGFEPPAVERVNPIGCGDAVLGGVVAGLCDGLPLRQAVQLGIASAADKLGRVHPGRVVAPEVHALGPRVRLHELAPDGGGNDS